MTTSGTVGTTTIDTALVLEHAFRRCKVKAAMQTPENVALAKENLYLLLLSLANRGLNLWCVETAYLGLNAGQATYEMPTGTIDVLNAIVSQPTQATGTDTTAATSIATELSADTTIVRIGVKMSSVTASDTLTLAQSADGVAWTTISTHTKTDWATGEMYWFALDPSVENLHFRASFANATTFTEFYLASAINDQPLTQWNRDTWAALNDKNTQASTPSNYYYERKIDPRMTLWPVPSGDYNHLTLFRHRQVQDVGTLTQTLEIPQRWVEGIIWQLTLRLAFELEEVPPALITTITQMADTFLKEVEREETDGATLFLQPNISGYTV